MRSRALFHRSRHVLKSYPYSNAFTSCSALVAGPRRALHATPSAKNRTHTRNASSATASSATASPSESSPPEENEEPRPRPRGRMKRSTEKAETALPPNLDILWPVDDTHTPQPASLPPPELLQEALNNLLITLHPQTQHRATYSAPNGPPIEPTLALYCPIEGGDYVIDETVRELARKTKAEVIVLDTIEIAAGEWGAFGKGTYYAVELPNNPLHFSSLSSHTFPAPASPMSVDEDSMEDEEEDDSDAPRIIVSTSQPFPFSQLNFQNPRSSRSGSLVTGRMPPSKAKAFFDEIVNMPSPPSGEESKDSSSTSKRPRIIYVKDYPTLAPAAASWFSSLVTSVRARRKGPISRPTSPVANPTTIVLGMTPPIVPPRQSSSGNMDTRSSLLSMLLSSRAPSVYGRRIAGKAADPWDESEPAQSARERRLRERLRNWENGNASFYEELPKSPAISDQATESHLPGTGLLIAGPSSQGFGPSLLAARPIESSNEEEDNSFFRLSVVVPKVRTIAMEKECRIARRRHINELTLRMAIGNIGGVLSAQMDLSGPPQAEETKAVAPHRADDMWNEWGQRVEVWSSVKEIADRALGNVVVSLSENAATEKTSRVLSLEPTPIPWSAIQSAWVSHRNTRSSRRVWIEESSTPSVEEKIVKNSENEKESEIDELIEKVKRDNTLDDHETRLVGCIVDPSSLSTTFDQVHLPPHTIDSVRTMVSLPLLYPQAFTHGILKQYAMSGALLFGPPGTGKTLIVRALAKESGTRMLMIKPSDVMDMYVGEGEKLVRSVFSLARRLSPCVIFLDELDALLGARVSGRETGSAMAHRGIITEFMQEMDGLKTSSNSNVIVIGATNRPFDLDDAVLRRLPRRLLVDLPGEKERYEILKILLRGETLSPDVDLHHLAKRTESFSGSDLKHLCVAAALDAVKEHVVLPWVTPSKTGNETTESKPISEPTADELDAASEKVIEDTGTTTASDPLSSDPSSYHPRILHLAHFTKALKDISPSASESLGTLAALRTWNKEFGEGSKQRKRTMWGGRFGFSHSSQNADGKVDTDTTLR
ncbi:AAA-domain-containing protein [Hysterangium stoloniferum]|nr:AAA-domain-containing protein [Hysterangium stoloniferum]